jgi:hypothetical protein
MHATFNRVGTILLTALALALPGLRAGGSGGDARAAPPEKEKPVTVADLREKLKAGTFKLTEADVVKLCGQPARIKRPGDNGADLRMYWDYSTYIYVTFKDGKLSEVSGAFSDNLPVENVTMANFKRLRVGMSEADVVKILGEGNGTAKADKTTVRSWGRTGGLSVGFNAKGLAFGEEYHTSTAISLPPGVQLPLPGTIKP